MVGEQETSASDFCFGNSPERFCLRFGQAFAQRLAPPEVFAG